MSTCDEIIAFTVLNLYSESASQIMVKLDSQRANSAFPVGNVTKPLFSFQVAGTFRPKCRQSVTKYLSACSLSIRVLSLIMNLLVF